MTEGERKSVVAEVGGWLWGTIEGGFNEQQTISQIVVDAAIGMIPVVGDVTAARDLIATILRLVERPEKRKEKLEWVTLALLLFALLPVAGGAIKGVGRLLIKAGAETGEHAALLRKLVAVLNRLGEGNAVKFIRELSFEKHAPELLARWRAVVAGFDRVLGSTLAHFRARIPQPMIARLEAIQKGLRELAELGEKMIPESLKELNLRLRAVQRHLYEGEWHEIAAELRTSKTLEHEARLVETLKEAEQLGERVAHPHFPPNGPGDFERVAGWPDLNEFVDKGKKWVIAGFSGEIKPVRLPGGTKIRRVVTGTSNTAGSWWVYELPRSGQEWREDLAVLDAWSSNGFFVELIVPPEGLWVWEGKTATQFQEDLKKLGAGQYLPGGGTQLFVDFTFAKNASAGEVAASLPRIPTGWSDVMGVGVPSKEVAAELLGAQELASKVTRGAGAAQRAVRPAAQDDSSRRSSP